MHIDELVIQSGGSRFFQIDGNFLILDDGANTNVPALHSVKNVGTSPYIEYLVEFKKLR